METSSIGRSNKWVKCGDTATYWTSMAILNFKASKTELTTVPLETGVPLPLFLWYRQCFNHIHWQLGRQPEPLPFLGPTSNYVQVLQIVPATRLNSSPLPVTSG